MIMASRGELRCTERLRGSRVSTQGLRSSFVVPASSCLDAYPVCIQPWRWTFLQDRLRDDDATNVSRILQHGCRLHMVRSSLCDDGCVPPVTVEEFSQQQLPRQFFQSGEYLGSIHHHGRLDLCMVLLFTIATSARLEREGRSSQNAGLAE